MLNKKTNTKTKKKNSTERIYLNFISYDIFCVSRRIYFYYKYNLFYFFFFLFLFPKKKEGISHFLHLDSVFSKPNATHAFFLWLPQQHIVAGSISFAASKMCNIEGKDQTHNLLSFFFILKSKMFLLFLI